MRLQGKTAIVTGGSRGIGKAIALKLAKEGANIVVNYTRSADKAEAVVAELKELGVEALAVQADVSQAEDVKNLLDATTKSFDSIDILVNNAGITKDNLLIRMKDEEWDDVLNINLKGAFLTTKLIGKKMMRQKSGKIINVTSVVGIMGNAGQANYAASKAGLIGLTKSSAKEFASRGININAVAPGFIATEMTDALGEDMLDNYKKTIPLGKLGEAEDIANAVAFLSSEESKYITGQVLVVDGGIRI